MKHVTVMAAVEPQLLYLRNESRNMMPRAYKHVVAVVTCVAVLAGCSVSKSDVPGPTSEGLSTDLQRARARRRASADAYPVFLLAFSLSSEACKVSKR